MEAGLLSLLFHDSNVLSSPGKGLFYPLALPPNTKQPCSTYQRISTATLNTLSGPADFTVARMQFDHWAEQYGDCKATASAVNGVLEGYTGTLPDGTYVFDISLESMNDQFDQDSRIYRVSADYFIRFSRTTPAS